MTRKETRKSFSLERVQTCTQREDYHLSIERLISKFRPLQTLLRQSCTGSMGSKQETPRRTTIIAQRTSQWTPPGPRVSVPHVGPQNLSDCKGKKREVVSFTTSYSTPESEWPWGTWCCSCTSSCFTMTYTPHHDPRKGTSDGSVPGSSTNPTRAAKEDVRPKVSRSENGRRRWAGRSSCFKPGRENDPSVEAPHLL